MAISRTGSTSANTNTLGFTAPPGTNFAIICVDSPATPSVATLDTGTVALLANPSPGGGANVLSVYSASLPPGANTFRKNSAGPVSIVFYGSVAAAPQVEAGSIQSFTAPGGSTSMSAPITVDAATDWAIVCTGIALLGSTGMSATPSLTRVQAVTNQAQIWDSNGQTETPGSVANTIAWAAANANAAVTFSITDVVSLSLSESGSASDTPSVTVALTLNETGNAVDAAVTNDFYTALSETANATDAVTKAMTGDAFVVEAGDAEDVLTEALGTPFNEYANAQDAYSAMWRQRATVLVIGVPGAARSGPNAVFGSDVLIDGHGLSGPVVIEYDFSPFFSPELDEGIVEVVSPGNTSVVSSERTGQPLSQVDALSAGMPTGGSCTVMTNFNRQITLSFTL